MKTKELIKNIKGVFKLPKKKYYLGKIIFGTPYFDPWNFNKNIISIRKLQKRTDNELDEYLKLYPYSKRDKDNVIYKNLPIVRRCKEKIIKLSGNNYWIQIGFPIAIKSVGLGWKDKYDTPRYEWSPQFHILFFHWQFCIFWETPSKDNHSDSYYEQVLWYINYCNSDIEKAKKTWQWVDVETKQSTWNNDYLV